MPESFPPTPLGRFPGTMLVGGTAVFRIGRARDPHLGTPRVPWFFSSLPTEHPGRFDVPAPDGCCYFSDRRYGAWLEVFRGTGLVDRADIEHRRMFVATRTGPTLRLANLRAPAARRFGVTADLVAGDDYALPQTWAVALLRARFPGLSATVRHDPTHTARTIVVFGPAGARARVSGWRVVRTVLAGDAQLLAELAPFGTGVAPRPYDVPVVPVI